MRDLAVTLLRRLLPLLALLAFVPAAQAEPCRTNCLAPGDYDLQMQSGGYLRLYRVHVPQRYSGQAPVALVVDVHGHALTNDDQMKRSGQREQSDRLGFVVVWPQGIANSWNGQGCCTVAYDLKVDDVGFLRSVIGELKARTNIDAGKVYVTGWSNGAGLTQRMACEAADLVTAIAPVAHPVNTADCRPSRPVSVLAFHGTADETIPYDGGGTVLPREILGVPLGWQGARASLAAWKGIAGCSSTLTATQLAGASRDESYRSCAGGASVGLVTVADGKHDLYTDTGLPGRVDVAAYIWSHVFRP
jgi:polyhydroxybutyrate depolymerase